MGEVMVSSTVGDVSAAAAAKNTKRELVRRYVCLFHLEKKNFIPRWTVKDWKILKTELDYINNAYYPAA